MAYLTIDDVPSRLFAEKLAYLEELRLPALLFCVGEQARGREDELAEALASGCLLGNHSYSHPRFSELSIDACRREIERTDALLQSIYDLAGLAWEPKLFRFPYFDRGAAGRDAARLQLILRELGYRAPAAQGGDRADTDCSFDQKEYCLDDPEEVYARIDASHPGPGDVILIHDHEKSHKVFFECVDRYREHGLRFDSVT
jgi:peptidoglycan-N-acetylglucosamine deacetylase